MYRSWSPASPRKTNGFHAGWSDDERILRFSVRGNRELLGALSGQAALVDFQDGRAAFAAPFGKLRAGFEATPSHPISERNPTVGINAEKHCIFIALRVFPA
jgi:hypothetical protein